MAGRTLGVAPPALPLPADQYSGQDARTHHNVLRLFFNRLTESLNQLGAQAQGGAALYSPYATSWSFVQQNTAVANTPQTVDYDTTIRGGFGYASGVYTADNAGAYLASGHLRVNSSSGTHDIAAWMRVNGTDVSDSTVRTTVSTSLLVPFSKVMFLGAGDTIELVFAATSTNLFLDTDALSGNYPPVPSAAFNLTFVSNV